MTRVTCQKSPALEIVLKGRKVWEVKAIWVESNVLFSCFPHAGTNLKDKNSKFQ